MLTTQNMDLQFTIVADQELEITRVYDMFHSNESVTEVVSSLFIIDPDKIIRLTMIYPMNVGRDFDEILRVIDTLQLGDQKTNRDTC